MRRRIGRMIVVVVFLLLVFGFYPIDRIVLAAEYKKSDGDWTIFGTDIYCNVTGNVGIGDTAPDGKLEVNPDGIEDNGDEFVVDSTGNVADNSDKSYVLLSLPLNIIHRSGVISW